MAESLIRFVDGDPPPYRGDVYATAAFVDTAEPRGHALIRRFIGPDAEKILAKHPGRYVLYVLWPNYTSWVRVCPTEELVIHEATKIPREALQIAPQVVELALFLSPELRQRVKQAVLDGEARLRKARS